MDRRRFLMLSLVAVGLAAAGFAVLRVSSAAGTERPPLKDVLKYDLRARLPRELAFIDQVVILVDSGVLPRKLVLGTFQWARRQSTVYPFPYFEFALRRQAQALGVTI